MINSFEEHRKYLLWPVNFWAASETSLSNSPKKAYLYIKKLEEKTESCLGKLLWNAKRFLAACLEIFFAIHWEVQSIWACWDLYARQVTEYHDMTNEEHLSILEALMWAVTDSETFREHLQEDDPDTMSHLFSRGEAFGRDSSGAVYYRLGSSTGNFFSILNNSHAYYSPGKNHIVHLESNCWELFETQKRHLPAQFVEKKREGVRFLDLISSYHCGILQYKAYIVWKHQLKL